MSVFSELDFADHEEVAFFCDRSAGLQAIIAIHDTRRGPALGGCRMWPYPSDRQALADVLRLARGMTYKAVMAGLDLGGGKSVIIGDPRREKSDALLRAFGRAVERMGGRYIVAEDAGTSVDDMRVIATATAHVAGVRAKPTADGERSGDPSPATAYGVFVGLRAAVAHRLGRNELRGLRVAVQGLGNVGYRLARQLHEAGARLWVSDLDAERCRRATAEFGAEAVAADQIHGLDVDVFAPCALGAVLNDATVAALRAAVVAGAANNQLAEARHGRLLAERGVLYAPDYVINAGGLIDIWYERAPVFERERLIAHLEGIGATLGEIFRRADAEGAATSEIADRLAEQRLRQTNAGA